MTFKTKFRKKAKSSELRIKLVSKLDLSYFTIRKKPDNPKKNEFTKWQYIQLLVKFLLFLVNHFTSAF
jgi:hypothetical protein